MKKLLSLAVVSVAAVSCLAGNAAHAHGPMGARGHFGPAMHHQMRVPVFSHGRVPGMPMPRPDFHRMHGMHRPMPMPHPVMHGHYRGWGHRGQTNVYYMGGGNGGFDWQGVASTAIQALIPALFGSSSN